LINKILEVRDSNLTGVKQIYPSTDFQDHRGQYVELYNKEIFHKAGIKLEFIQDDISISKRNVLRGIHGDNETWKLISCLYGSIYFVVVNNDPNSEQYLNWQTFNLSEKNRHMILVPPKFGNGHLVTSEKAVFFYKQTTNYDISKQFTLKWNDNRLSIEWPISNPILSVRDSN